MRAVVASRPCATMAPSTPDRAVEAEAITPSIPIVTTRCQSTFCSLILAVVFALPLTVLAEFFAANLLSLHSECFDLQRYLATAPRRLALLISSACRRCRGLSRYLRHASCRSVARTGSLAAARAIDVRRRNDLGGRCQERCCAAGLRLGGLLRPIATGCSLRHHSLQLPT